jgi:chemotaxis signal transduction protein
MKQSRYMLFTINNYKFAIQVNKIHDILDRTQIFSKKLENNCIINSLRYRGIEVPIIDVADILKKHNFRNDSSNSILLIELVFNSKSLLAGLAIDEILEIGCFDFLNTNCLMFDSKRLSFHENLLMIRNEPYILVDTEKLNSHYYAPFFESQNIRLLAN